MKRNGPLSDKCNPKNLQNALKQETFHLALMLPYMLNPVNQIRQPHIIKDDLIKMWLLGSLHTYRTTLNLSPDIVRLGLMFAQHILVVTETKPAFPRSKLKQMKSYILDAA